MAKSGTLCCKKQGAIDGALHVALANFRFNQLFAIAIPVFSPLNTDGFEVAELGLHCEQLAGLVGLKLKHLADSKASEALGFGAAVDHLMQSADAQVCFFEKH